MPNPQPIVHRNNRLIFLKYGMCYLILYFIFSNALVWNNNSGTHYQNYNLDKDDLNGKIVNMSGQIRRPSSTQDQNIRPFNTQGQVKQPLNSSGHISSPSDVSDQFSCRTSKPIIMPDPDVIIVEQERQTTENALNSGSVALNGVEQIEANELLGLNTPISEDTNYARHRRKQSRDGAALRENVRVIMFSLNNMYIF